MLLFLECINSHIPNYQIPIFYCIGGYMSMPMTMTMTMPMPMTMTMTMIMIMITKYDNKITLFMPMI